MQAFLFLRPAAALYDQLVKEDVHQHRVLHTGRDHCMVKDHLALRE